MPEMTLRFCNLLLSTHYIPTGRMSHQTKKLPEEVQEVEHVKNDSLCTERRIFGMFPFGIDCFNWSGPLN